MRIYTLAFQDHAGRTCCAPKRLDQCSNADLYEALYLIDCGKYTNGDETSALEFADQVNLILYMRSNGMPI